MSSRGARHNFIIKIMSKWSVTAGSVQALQDEKQERAVRNPRRGQPLWRGRGLGSKTADDA